MKHKLTNFDWIVINLIVHNLLINYLNLKIASIQKQLLTAVLERFKKSEAAVYGCSFDVKLSWKRKIFFWKNLCVFYKIYIICRKNVFIRKNSFILKNVFTEKNVFYREKYKWKCKKFRSHLKNIFLYRKCLCYK